MVSADETPDSAEKVAQHEVRCDECGKRTSVAVYDEPSISHCVYPNCAEKEGEEGPPVFFYIPPYPALKDNIVYSRDKDELLDLVAENSDADF